MKHTIVFAVVWMAAFATASVHADDPKPGEQTTAATRIERDLLGEKQVPAQAYYGVQTARALENFQISSVGMNFYPEFVDAFAIVKLAAARANTKVGAMKPEIRNVPPQKNREATAASIGIP